MAKKATKKTAPRTRKEKPLELFSGSQATTMKRSEIQTAEYNPRTITPYAFERLKENIRRTGGLVQAIMVNSSTGNTVVSGHQRLKASDELRGYRVEDGQPVNDYLIPVEVVEWSVEKEIEVNVAMNNPTMQGDYDLELLGDIISQPEIDIEGTGFSYSDLEVLYHSSGLDLPESLQIPDDPEVDAVVDDVLDTMDAAEVYKKQQEDQEKIANIKDAKKKFAEKAEYAGQNFFFAMLVFKDEDHKNQFTAHVEGTTDAEFITGETVASMMGFEFLEPVATQGDDNADARSESD